MLVQDIVYKARALLDAYTEDGIVIAADELADFQASAILHADSGQKELYKVGRIEKTIEFSNRPIANELGYISNFDIYENTGDDLYLPSSGGVPAKSYHISADLTHTVVVQELENGIWQDLITLIGTSETALKDYKGNLTLTTAGNLVRFKLVGGTYYHYSNMALFNVRFQDDASVPSYKPWVELEMPSDFRVLDAVVKIEGVEYNQSSTYKFENPDRLYYDYYFKGTMKIIHKPIPTQITSLTQELEIDDIAAEALAFYIASWLAPYENQSLANPLFQKFAELKVEASQEQPVSEEFIGDFYGGFNNA
jgi:hypothetical protein